jgi:hypothetical protein
VVHIFLQEVIDRLQGVFVGSGIEIQGASQEVFGCVGNEELVGCGRISSYIERDASYPIGRMYQRLVDGRSLVSVLKGHLKSVVPQLVESVAIGSNVLIADVELCVEPGKIDVDPIRVFRFCLEESAVLHYISVHGIFEGIGVAWLIESTVLMPGQVYFEVSPSFWVVFAVTGRNKD